MADEDTVLEEAMENLKEAGQDEITPLSRRGVCSAKPSGYLLAGR
jgi:hypothetical protein